MGDRLAENGLQPVAGGVFQLVAFIGEEPITNFQEEITVRFPLASTAIDSGELNYLAVYRLSDRAGSGIEEYIPSRLYSSEGEREQLFFEVQLERFSLFALLKSQQTFADLEGHWAREEVEILTARRVVSGVGDNVFAPQLPVTRAQLATLLVNTLQLEPVIPEKPTFYDVNPGAWYYVPVETAYEKGLVVGIGGGQFAPDSPVSRQELAVMVSGLLELTNGVSTDSYRVEANLLRFADREMIAPWAAAGVARLVQERIMTGLPGRRFAPEEQATRAQAAVVLVNTLKASGYLI